MNGWIVARRRLRRLLIARVDRARVALLELVERAEEAGAHEVEDRPDLGEAVLDRRAGQREAAIGLEALRRARRRAERVLDVLRLVEDRVAEIELREDLLVAAEERVARDDDVGVLELVGALLAIAAVPDDVLERRRELVELALPVRDDARRRDDERLELLLAVGLRVLLDRALHGEEQRDRLDRLSETHVVGEDAARADLVEEPEPLEALLLIRTERAFRLRGFLTTLISSTSWSFLKSSFAPSETFDLADLLEQLLDAARLRERELARPARRRSRGSRPGAGAPPSPCRHRASRTSRPERRT